MKCIKCNNDMRLDKKGICKYYVENYYICDDCNVFCWQNENKKREIWTDKNGHVIKENN